MRRMRKRTAKKHATAIASMMSTITTITPP
jgi:hypothetical protein